MDNLSTHSSGGLSSQEAPVAAFYDQLRANPLTTAGEALQKSKMISYAHTFDQESISTWVINRRPADPHPVKSFR